MKTGAAWPGKVSWRIRLWCLAASAACATIILASAWLLPRPGGHGTHRQLGLPSCGYLARTGYPCPGCGVTTSIAAMACGQISLAFRAQPFGVVVFAGVVFTGAIGLVEFLTGWAGLSRIRPRLWWILPAVGVWLLGWACKLLTGIASGEYPVGR